MENMIYGFLLSSLLPIVKKDEERNFALRQFYLDNIETLRNKKVLLYGAGAVGQDLCEQLLSEKIDVIGFLDKDLNKDLGKQIKRINLIELSEICFDIILICILSESLFKEIKKMLVDMGIKTDKILWIKPKRYY